MWWILELIFIQTFPIETSAHTLCFAALLLALHPDKQWKVLQEITNLWPNGAPTLDSFTVGGSLFYFIYPD